MSSINTLQKTIADDFAQMGDAFGQYAYLIEMSAALPEYPQEYRTEEHLVKGCQSKVWLHTYHTADGLFAFDADSDTLIIKGVLFILQTIFNGKPPQEVASAKVWIFEQTDIMVTFNSDRQKGIGYIIRRLQELAKNAAG
ncbi:MAG: SufE family protein [Oscillospiraceae bacterium]|nr:SufE family protein [Oscillospiraceae bacterium]